MLVKVVLVLAGKCGVSEAEAQACAAALSRQAQEHFALPPPLGYGIGATCRVASNPFDVQPDEWVLALLERPDQAGALGYHDQTPAGEPLMKIFPLLDIADGAHWQVTASHELLETLADPNCARAAQAADGKFWAYEVCDAVEQFSYLIDGVPVSDFVTPAYFEPVKSKVRYDHMGLVKRPLEILQGGYGQYFDAAKGWVQVYPAARRAYREQVAGRGARRAGRP